MQRPQLYVKPNLFVEAKARTTEMPSLRKRLLTFEMPIVSPIRTSGELENSPTGAVI